MRFFAIKWAFVLACAVGTILLTDRALWKIVLFLAFTCAALLLEFLLRYHNKGEIPQKDTKGRCGEYDHLRLLATGMVVLLHVIEADAASDASGMILKAAVLCLPLLMACNQMFVMLSGSLLIPFKKENPIFFYLKRCSRVVIPMILYYIWYYFCDMKFQDFNSGFFLRIRDELWLGENELAPHYWILYTLLGVYLAIPILRYAFKDMPYQTLLSLVLVCLALLGLMKIFPDGIFYNEIPYWLCIAVIGYWVSRPETRKFDYFLFGLGFAACLLSILHHTEPSATGIYNCPVSMALFALVFRFSGLFGRSGPAARFLSRYSFGILLIHWWVLYHFSRGLLSIHADSFRGFGILLSLVFTFAGSLMVSFFFDNVFVYFFQTVFREIAGLCKKKIFSRFFV